MVVDGRGCIFDPSLHIALWPPPGCCGPPPGAAVFRPARDAALPCLPAQGPQRRGRLCLAVHRLVQSESRWPPARTLGGRCERLTPARLLVSRRSWQRRPVPPRWAPTSIPRARCGRRRRDSPLRASPRHRFPSATSSGGGAGARSLPACRRHACLPRSPVARLCDLSCACAVLACAAVVAYAGG